MDAKLANAVHAAALLDGLAVKSRLTLAAACEGHEILPIKDWVMLTESLQDSRKRSFNVSIQCGFCSPGFIVAGVEYLKNGGKADRKEIKQAISGHLCRCTGYENVYLIYKVAAAKWGRRALA